MTIAVWPPELPPPLIQGYSETAGEGRNFAQAEQGPPRVRRRASLVADAATYSIRVEPQLRARFDRFWHEDTDRGTLPFAIPDPGRDGLPLGDDTGAALTDEAGHPILIAATWLCLFGQRTPSHSPVGPFTWDIAFDLMVMP